MSAADVLAMLHRIGIRLEVVGDRLRYYPRSAMPADLVEQLKAEKVEVLRLLRSPPVELSDAPPLALGSDGWPVDSFDSAGLAPCPACRRLELWQTLADGWRCQRCDPPTAARRLAEAAERIRRRRGR